MNESALQVVTLVSPDKSSNEVAIQKLNDNEDSCCVFFDHLEDKIVLIHKFYKLGSSIHDPSEKFVGLLHFDDLALSTPLQPDIMEKHLTFPAPKHATAKDKKTASGFTETMADTGTPINARQIIALPPFIASTIIISGEANPALIGTIITYAI